MASRRRQRKAKGVEDFHSFLSVESIDAEVRAGINHNAYSPTWLGNLDDRDPVYEFGSSVRISAKLIYADRRCTSCSRKLACSSELHTGVSLLWQGRDQGQPFGPRLSLRNAASHNELSSSF